MRVVCVHMCVISFNHKFSLSTCHESVLCKSKVIDRNSLELLAI